MVLGHKRRKWMAFMSVSASGPEFSPVFEERGQVFRPRTAADLRYTTADVDYFDAQLREPNYDSGQQENHWRLRNPTREKFFQVLDEVEVWLGGFRSDPDWDGGGFQLTFAGHGRGGDGALVVSDGVIAPGDLIGSLAGIAGRISPPGRLRISAVLDSCHSGAFVMEILDACFNKHELLVPFHLLAACMEDEYSWEESSLGHGLFTYCYSVMTPELGSIAAQAIQPDNTFGPSLEIAAGELGCSLLTAGAQNPVIYWNGAGHLEVGNQYINLFETGTCMSLDEMRTRLKSVRDDTVKVIRPMRPRLSIGRATSETRIVDTGLPPADDYAEK